MKFLNKNNAVITLLLFVMLLVLGFMLIRLEIKASTLQSRLDEHHKQLQVNSDVLEGLVFFDRGTAKANIHLTEDIAFLKSELASIKLQNNKVEIETPGDIQIGNGNDISFGYNKKVGQLYMYNKDSKMVIGKLNIPGGGVDYGSILTTKSGVQFEIRDKGIGAYVPGDKEDYHLIMARLKKYVELKKDNSIIRFEGDSINIEGKGNINIKASEDIKFGYNKKVGQLYMYNKDSKMVIGKLNIPGGGVDYGSILTTKSGVQFEIRDKGIGAYVPGDKEDYHFIMARLKKYVELKKDNSIIRFEGDNINIEADGDINITSKNGKVNINGKR